MRADHSYGQLTRQRSGQCRRKLRHRRLQRAQRKRGCGMKHAPDAGEQRVLSRWRQERDTERRAVFGKHRRDRDPSEIKQIDEVGVGPEIAVEPHRIGFDLRHRVGRRCRRDRYNSAPWR